MRPAWWFSASAAAVAVLLAADGVPSPEAPSINVGGVVNAASSIPAPNNFVSPGAIISIYGTGLAKEARVAGQGDLDGGFLPVTLGGVTVLFQQAGNPSFNGILAPLFYISPLQINAQVPVELQPGQWQIKVKVDSLQSSEIVDVEPFSPGIFASFRHVDGTLVTLKSPARPSEFILYFGTGFGPTWPAIHTGEVAPPLSQIWLAEPVQVQATIGGEALTKTDIYYWGLAPGFAGLYQFNLRVPADAPNGNLEVRVGVDQQWSQPSVTIPVGR